MCAVVSTWGRVYLSSLSREALEKAKSRSAVGVLYGGLGEMGLAVEYLSKGWCWAGEQGDWRVEVLWPLMEQVGR